ncbi:MAG: hypothetical protein KGJ93_05170 [Patescibacteria group bacterium]|nr:hypothetical protein [Patescibacteria group bacterium]
MNPNKKYYGPIVVLIVLLAIIAVVARTRKSAPAPQQQSSQSSASQPSLAAGETKVLPQNEIPSGLPADLPLDKAATAVQNFESKAADGGKTQFTRVYLSAQSMDDNFTAYQDYLQKQGWHISETMNLAVMKKLVAEKSGATMEITISKDPSGKTLVNVTVTQ